MGFPGLRLVIERGQHIVSGINPGDGQSRILLSEFSGRYTDAVAFLVVPFNIRARLHCSKGKHRIKTCLVDAYKNIPDRHYFSPPTILSNIIISYFTDGRAKIATLFMNT